MWREGECKENKWKKNNTKHDMAEGDGEKVKAEKDGLMTGRKEAGGKVNDQVDAKQRSYSEAVIEGALRTERVFMGDYIL